MKHDPQSFVTQPDTVEETAPRAGGCGARCMCDGCTKDCCKDSYHDGPHRCYNHLTGCT
ncbi:MAG: hypothetical protein QNJ16_17105 [Rhodobacter sp.]|nr:hypothetical protein [Rhodobacter sp.]